MSSEITRRNFIGRSAVTAAGIGLAGSFPQQGAAEEPSGEKRPNLVFVFGDQLRYFSCGYAGDKLAHTPNLDMLAASGTNFDQCVSSTPVCSAFRASLMTGKYTTSHGMVINELRLSPDHDCIGHVLSRASYSTGYIGKWHLWANQLGHHDSDRNAFIPPGPYRLGFDGLFAGFNFHHLNFRSYYYTDTPEKQRYDRPFEPDAQTDMAIRFIEEQKTDQPFSLFLSIGTPHDPWGKDNSPGNFYRQFEGVEFPTPPNYSTTRDPYADGWGTPNAYYHENLQTLKQGYYAQVANLDWNVGRIIDSLRAKGELENTVFVFTSDHGEMFGAQGRRAKNTFYEEAARIPFLVSQPGRVVAGQKSDACMTTPDMMPTVLGLLGLPIPEEVEGMNLSHIALGEEGDEPEAALLQNTGACAAWQDGFEWRALRDKRFTYAIYRRDGSELLFDNQNDPYQTKNLIDNTEHAADRDRLRAMLKTRMAELDDDFPASLWYRENWIENRNIMRGARGGTHDLKQLAEIQKKYFSEAWG